MYSCVHLEFLRVPSVDSLEQTTNQERAALDSMDANISASSYSLYEHLDAVASEDDVEIQELLQRHEESERNKTNGAGIIYQEEKSETGTVSKKTEYFKYSGKEVNYFFWLSSQVLILCFF